MEWVNIKKIKPKIGQFACAPSGKTHDTIVEHMGTGERLEELEKCKGCLFKPYFNMVHVADNNIEPLTRPETPAALRELEDQALRDFLNSSGITELNLVKLLDA